MKNLKLLKKLLSGSKNIHFSEAVECAKLFGFQLSRISGSHHIFIHPKTKHLINLQEVKGKAKPYQVQQLLRMIEKNDLQIEGRQMEDER